MVNAGLIKDGALGNKSKFFVKAKGMALRMQIGLGMSDRIGFG